MSIEQKTKKVLTPKERYTFRYWRRGFRAIGLNLDRIALRNGLQYEISGWCSRTVMDPGRALMHARNG